MPLPEIAHQYDLFTGQMLDVRTAAQKRRDGEREKPQQIGMFGTREIIEQAQTRLPAHPMLNQGGGRLELALMVQDPRSDAQVEADRLKAAQDMTSPMFGPEKAPGRPSPVETAPPKPEKPAAPKLAEEKPKPEASKPATKPVEESGTTPVFRQYSELKKQFPHAVVLFRLGDFYEAFDQDAEILSRELDTVLTSRNVSKSRRVPMAGVPFHAAEGYIARLIEKGYHVAVIEQVGTEPVNGLLPRDVTRIITPATRLAEEQQPPTKPETAPRGEQKAAPAVEATPTAPGKVEDKKDGRRTDPPLGRVQGGTVVIFDRTRVLLPF